MSDSEDEMPPTPLSPHAGGGGGPGFSFGDHRSNADDEDDDEMPPTPLSPGKSDTFSFEGKDVAIKGGNDLADFKEPAAPEMTSTPAPMSPLKARIQARREAEQATLELSAKQSNDALKEGGARDKSKKVEEEEVAAAAAEENEGRGAPVSPVPTPTPTSVPEGDEDEASVPEAADAAAASIGAGTLHSNPAHCGGDHEAREGGGSGGEASTTEDNTADDENEGANEAFEQVITFVKPEDGVGMAVSLLQL